METDSYFWRRNFQAILLIAGTVVLSGIFVELVSLRQDLKERPAPAASVVLAPATLTLRDEHIDRELKDLHQQLNRQSEMLNDHQVRIDLHTEWLWHSHHNPGFAAPHEGEAKSFVNRPKSQ